MEQILVELVAVAGIGGLSWLLSRSLRGPEQRLLQDGVRHLGLRARQAMAPRVAVARGLVEGMRVRVRYVDTQGPKQRDRPWPAPTARVRVEVDLPEPLPGGLRLRSMSVGQHLLEALGAQDIQVGHARLDEALRVVCQSQEEARVLLSDPDLRQALDRATAHLDNALEVDPTQVRLERSGPRAVDARPIVDSALQVARALRSAQQAPWQRLVATLGLDPGEVGPDGRRRMEGQLDGVQVELRLMAGDEERPPTTIVRARIHPPLPAELRLRGKAVGESTTGQSTGNPVLDTAVVMHCIDLDRARAMLARDALMGPLMELLHGHAEARITTAAVMISTPGWSSLGVEERVRLVAEVTRELQVAAAVTAPLR